MVQAYDPKEVVMGYIKAMDSRDYESARSYLSDKVFIKGPAGEAFRNPEEFIDMMKQQNGRYSMKKVFADGDDVCVLYDFVAPTVTAFFCSWYQVRDGKITSIQTIFDSKLFAPKKD